MVKLPRTPFPLDHVVRLMVEENPKRLGSKARLRFEHYRRPEMTVAEALAAGLNRRDLRWDAARSFIMISAPRE